MTTTVLNEDSMIFVQRFLHDHTSILLWGKFIARAKQATNEELAARVTHGEAAILVN